VRRLREENTHPLRARVEGAITGQERVDQDDLFVGLVAHHRDVLVPVLARLPGRVRREPTRELAQARDTTAMDEALDLCALHQQALADGCEPVVGALILKADAQAFVHRRGYDRAFLPGCWDIVGGHVEAGESLLEALAREVEEETGWSLAGDPELVHVADWQLGGPKPRREFDFLVEVAGDLSQPRLELPKHVEFRWLGSGDLDLLAENRAADGGLVRRLVELALRSAEAGALRFPHATVFIEGEARDEVDSLRARWDPAMARQIGPHVTVAYPNEVPSLDEMSARVEAAANAAQPFRLRLWEVRRFAQPDDGLYLAIDDVTGGWDTLREAIVGRGEAPTAEPHLTLVHPRTSGMTERAWAEVSGVAIGREVAVREVAVTAFDGHVWQTVERFGLGAG
jgi:8-oxo-dGTP diphosphatase